ncbi:hypothetical protein V1522DRAFT_64298 [Lipomyces starkeyi]
MFSSFRVNKSPSCSSSAENSSNSSMSNFESSVPASPHPGQSPMPSCSRKRSHFSEDMKVTLVQLCVLHQNEYVRRRKSRFWRDISRLFEAKTGVPIRKPGQTVESLIRERREQLRYRSGIAEADTDLKQAVDVFMQRYDEVDQEERDLSAEKEELAENKRKTKAIRDQMMFGRERSDEDEGGIDDTISETQSLPGKKRTRLSKTDVIATTISSSTGAITNAITQLADALRPSAYDDSNVSTSFDRITEVEVQIHEVDKKVTELSKQFAETLNDIKNMLRK